MLTNKPDQISYLDHLNTPSWFGDYYALKVSTYFVPPVTGFYMFVAACDDACRVYLSNSDNPEDKRLIIDAGYAGIYDWNRYAQLFIRHHACKYSRSLKLQAFHK